MTASRALDVESLFLKSGGHKSADDGLCLMEAVAFIAGEPHSDHPACTSPVLASFGRRLNDRMTDDERQRLKPFVARLVGTADPGKEKTRANILAWAAVTEFCPAALRATKRQNLEVFAERLEGLTRYDWVAAKKTCQEARSAAADAAAYAAADAAAYAAADAAADAADAAADAAAYAAYAAYAAADAAAVYAAAYAAAHASAADAAAYAAAYAAYAAAYAAAADAAVYAAAYAAAVYAAVYARRTARAGAIDLALDVFDRAIRCEEVAP